MTNTQEFLDDIKSNLLNDDVGLDDYRKIVAALEVALEALAYIKDHKSFHDLPKWGNEFVEVATKSQARIEECLGK